MTGLLVSAGGVGVVLGGLFGTRHALETDHVAAVATLLDDETNALRTGAAWGVGHSIPIGAAGIAFLALDLTVPADVLTLFELLVGLLLLWLGIRVLAGRESVALVVHDHLTRADADSDDHAHSHVDLNGTLLGLGHSHVREESVAIGIIHGFAGSGGVVVALAAARPTVVGGLGFLLGFSVASILTMAIGAVIWGRAVERVDWLHSLAGVASIAAGMVLIVEIAGIGLPL